MNKNPKMLKAIPFILLIFFFSCSNKEEIATTNNFDYIQLPDNSVVYLNQNSSIQYDRGFASRHVQLEGEAFFDVAKGSTPFTITTPVGEIIVLGTEFNVKTEDESMEVEIEKGSVEVSTAKVKQEFKKGQRAFVEKGREDIATLKAAYEHQAWINNLKQEFKKLGKAIKEDTKEVRQESKRIGKEIGEESKKTGKEIGKDFKEGAKKLKDNLK